ncbi:MAG: ATP-binding protein [Candidatus Dormibacteria bacterium]
MRRRLRRTRLRLTLAYTLSFGAILVAVAVVLWLIVSAASLQAIDAALRASVRPELDAIDHRHDPVPPGENLDRGSNLPDNAPNGTAIDAVFIAGNGVLANSPGALQDGRVVGVAQRLHGPGSTEIDTADLGGTRRVLVVDHRDSGGVSGVLVVSTALGPIDADRTTLALGLAIAVLALLAAAGGLGYALAGAALRPVRRIAATARELSEHDLHRRIDLGLPDDELGELEATFNAMLGRLEVGFEALRRFSADAAHELRSPLALMRSDIEVTLARPRNAEDYRRSLKTVLTETLQLSRLVERLLIVARAESGILRPSLEEVDLGDLVPECLERWQARAGGRGVKLSGTVSDRAQVSADPTMIRQVVDNLVENAVRHSPEGGEVSVVVECGGDGWSMTVDDAGEGVPQDVRETVFERFVRADSSRSRKGGGAGIGLALCRAIVVAHGGMIVAEASPQGGARFVARFPSPC